MIKLDHRNCLSEHHMDNILRIMIDVPPLSHWDSTGAIHLWKQDKQRSVTDI